MPLYEYQCVKCGHRFEKIESTTASTTKKCPKCGAKAERVLSAAAIQFKGSGWYVTDYASKGSGSAPSETPGDGASAKPTEKSGDSKAEPKTVSPQNSGKVSDRKKK